MKIKSIIVGDKPFNIEVLADLLHESDYQVADAHVASNGVKAINRIHQFKPDLVFLEGKDFFSYCI